MEVRTIMMRPVVELMLRHTIHRVPVVRDAVPVGIVARHDILKLMVGDRVPK